MCTFKEERVKLQRASGSWGRFRTSKIRDIEVCLGFACVCLCVCVCVCVNVLLVPQESFLTPSVFGEIIYENFLFDIPKILDLCVLFGKGNSQLLHKMIGELRSKAPFKSHSLHHEYNMKRN